MSMATAVLVLSTGVPAQAQSPAGVIESCAYAACTANNCCALAAKQLAACKRTYEANAPAASRLGQYGAFAQQQTQECMRCSAVYLGHHCDDPREEAKLPPQPVDFEALTRSLAALQVDPTVIAEASVPEDGGGTGVDLSELTDLFGAFLSGFTGAMSPPGGGGGGGYYCGFKVGGQQVPCD